MLENTIVSEQILTCDGLCKSYVEPVIENLCLSLPAGKIVGLLGPNGSGKTTLIKMAAGLLGPTEGSLRILGREVSADTKRMVAYLPERNALPEQMTVNEVLTFLADMFDDFDTECAKKMISDLGLPTDRRIRHLSKGMKEKVQLITVMSRKARLYLLDEPIGGVDPATRDYVLETIIKCHAPDSTVLISTHLIADVEKVLDSFLFFQGGRIVASGDVAEFCEKEGATLDEIFRRTFRC